MGDFLISRRTHNDTRMITIRNERIYHHPLHNYSYQHEAVLPNYVFLNYWAWEVIYFIIKYRTATQTTTLTMITFNSLCTTPVVALMSPTMGVTNHEGETLSALVWVEHLELVGLRLFLLQTPKSAAIFL